MCELIADEKLCSGCHETKPLNHFSPHVTGLYGRSPKCKLCRNNAALRKRTEFATAPVDRRFKGGVAPFVKLDDGTFVKVKSTAPTRTRNPPQVLAKADTGLLLLDFFRAVSRPGETGNLAPVVRVDC